MKHLPLFADLRGRPCVVVGGGAVAERRVEQLAEAGASVTVIAPELTIGLTARAGAGRLRHLRERYEAQPLDAYWLVIAATDDPAVNARVFRAAEAAQRYCNVVDDPEHCTAIMPAVVERAPVTVAISSGGASPTLARWLKGLIETLVPQRIGVLAGLMASARRRVRIALPSATARRRFWDELIEGSVAEAALAGRSDEARERLAAELERAVEAAPAHGRGEAYLVGAGPGSADLITLRGRQLLARADVVLYDRLVNPELLAYARRDAELISVGKTPGRPSITQKQLNRLLVSLVQAGKRVCRLKGGDPMVFGRAAEELDALVTAQLPFQIVPGVSALEGCAAYAGIPLTMRGVAHTVRLTTGRTEQSGRPALPRHEPGQTLAFYMGVAHYAEIAAELIALGHPGATPVAIVENGTTSRQRVVRSCLSELGVAAAAFGIESPALLLVGETTRRAERYSWFASRRFHRFRPPEAARTGPGVASRQVV